MKARETTGSILRSKFSPAHPPYAVSKGATETLTLALAPEFGARGITINAVMPGVTETDMNAQWLAVPEARAGAASPLPFLEW